MVRNKLLELDKKEGRKRKREEAKQRRVNRKRLREFTAISPVGKKTKWYY